MYNHKNGVSLRKIEEDDLGELLELKRESWVTTHRVAILNEDDQVRWYESTPADALHMVFEIQGVYVPEAAGVVSLTAIDPVSRVASIGASVYKKYRGNETSRLCWEAGTDFAFEMLNLHRLDAEVVTNNLASASLCVNVGYRCEGRKRQSVYKCGHYLDSLVFGMLRSDWAATGRVLNFNGCCNINFKPRRDASQVLKRAGVELPPEASYGVVPADGLPADDGDVS